MEAILDETLAVGPATVLTNGLLLDRRAAVACAARRRLALLARPAGLARRLGRRDQRPDPRRRDLRPHPRRDPQPHRAGLNPVITVTEVARAQLDAGGQGALLRPAALAGDRTAAAQGPAGLPDRRRGRARRRLRELAAAARRRGAPEGLEPLQCSVLPDGHRPGRLGLPDPGQRAVRQDGRAPRRHLELLPARAPGLLDLPRLRRELPDLKDEARDGEARRTPQERPHRAPRPRHLGGAPGAAGRVPRARPRCRPPTSRRRPRRGDRHLSGAPADPTPVEGPFRIAVFGGVYNNHLGLVALLDAARPRAARRSTAWATWAASAPIPRRSGRSSCAARVRTIQGNYEESLASGREDCNCGYTDPRDNHFAALSYRYTAERTSPEFKAWMGKLPQRRRVRVGARELLLVHGSPRRINEFLFASHLARLPRATLRSGTGRRPALHPHRPALAPRDLRRPRRGQRRSHRPAGQRRHDLGLVVDPRGRRAAGRRAASCAARLRPRGAGREMRAERLPEEFVETILTGWWTTCLEILPAKERSAGRF